MIQWDELSLDELREQAVITTNTDLLEVIETLIISKEFIIYLRGVNYSLEVELANLKTF